MNKSKSYGKVGIDNEASPGVGLWFVEHFASNYNVVGFNSEKEALKELKYVEFLYKRNPKLNFLFKEYINE